jgi:hypothetical protein
MTKVAARGRIKVNAPRSSGEQNPARRKLPKESSWAFDASRAQRCTSCPPELQRVPPATQ